MVGQVPRCSSILWSLFNARHCFLPSCVSKLLMSRCLRFRNSFCERSRGPLCPRRVQPRSVDRSSSGNYRALSLQRANKNWQRVMIWARKPAATVCQSTQGRCQVLKTVAGVQSRQVEGGRGEWAPTFLSGWPRRRRSHSGGRPGRYPT